MFGSFFLSFSLYGGMGWILNTNSSAQFLIFFNLFYLFCYVYLYIVFFYITTWPFRYVDTICGAPQDLFRGVSFMYDLYLSEVFLGFAGGPFYLFDF